VLTHDTPVHCSSKELAKFTPPSGMTCQEYVQPFINDKGGYVNELNGQCQFCQYANGAEYAKSFNLFYDNRWRDYGVSFAFTIFNFALVFVCTWLYLGGFQRLRARFSKKTVKTEG
jgi:ATP-binding cassette subfamily G (WHITE) protein 2 (SNQ2)